MSLVIAYCGKRYAIIAGDRRSIVFAGDCSSIEDELYFGAIKTEEDLLTRAAELSATLQVFDGREKVWNTQGVLVGEVTDVSASQIRRRRIYVTPGAYLLADINNLDATITAKGKSTFIALGNMFTRDLAAMAVRSAGGTVNEALFRSIMQEASMKTATVSRDYTLLSSLESNADPHSAVESAFSNDCSQYGWSLCAQR